MHHCTIAPIIPSIVNATGARTMSTRYYFAEITDTFGGEANYSWVTRHKIRASSERGALIRVNRESGLGFRSVGRDRYDSMSGATCCFIVPWDDEEHGDLMHVSHDLA